FRHLLLHLPLQSRCTEPMVYLPVRLVRDILIGTTRFTCNTSINGTTWVSRSYSETYMLRPSCLKTSSYVAAWALISPTCNPRTSSLRSRRVFLEDPSTAYTV